MSRAYIEPVRLLIADNDLDLLNLVGFAFRNAGFETVGVTSGAEALVMFEREVFSLLVLDINMPAPNGLEVCSAVRQRSNVPVMMLSARDREEDLLQALDAGADAYLTKPFSPRTLIARVRALIRRAVPDESLGIVSKRFRLDVNESLLIHPSGVLALTRLEVRILRILMAKAGKIHTQSDLIEAVWNSYNTANRNMLKQVVFRLRRKLAAVPEALNALKTTSCGYRWSEEDPPSEVKISAVPIQSGTDRVSR